MDSYDDDDCDLSEHSPQGKVKVMDYEFETIPEMLLARRENDGERTALHVKRDGEYAALSWNQVVDDVFRYAAVLKQVGVEPGDRVVQFSENRYEWILSDLAIQICQAVHVPVHAPLSGSQVAAQIADCAARLALVSTPDLMNKLRDVESQIADDVVFLCFEPSSELACHATHGMAELLSNDTTPGESLFRESLKNLSSDSLATILYTSGTTGEPKGVMLNQRNLTTNALATRAAIGFERDDLRVGFLPLSHIFARTCDMYIWLSAGSEFALAESRETVVADCQQIKPTNLNGVPYFFELLRRAVTASGQAPPNALKNLLGGRIRRCFSGGAALPNHLFDFYNENGLPIFQGYGLTESSPVITVSSEQHVRRGAVGRAIPDVELKIADDGEIMCRGPNVMVGYWNRPEDTRQVVRDGWLCTGDLGYIDDDGFLFITGRKKELIVTAAGKNIAPVMIESLLTADPLIAQAVVIGDDRSYLTALIVPEKMVLDQVAGDSENVDLKRQIIEQAITQRLAHLSHHEQVRKFVLIDTPFSIEGGELTPKLSLRRAVIEEKFADLIESMYQKK